MKNNIAIQNNITNKQTNWLKRSSNFIESLFSLFIGESAEKAKINYEEEQKNALIQLKKNFLERFEELESILVIKNKDMIEMKIEEVKYQKNMVLLKL